MSRNDFTDIELQELSEWFNFSRKFSGEGSKWIKFGLSKALREKTDFVSVKRISTSILNAHNDLIGLSRKQVRKSKKNIKGLVFEHLVPLNSVVDRCLTSSNIYEIKNILQEMEVVWISENENNKLKKNGFHKNGRETKKKAEEAYRLCGIELQSGRPVTEKTQKDYPSDSRKEKDTSKYQFNGQAYGKGRLVLAIIKSYITKHPDVSLEELQDIFQKKLQGGVGVIDTYENVKAKYKDKLKRHFLNEKDVIKLKTGERIVVCNDWGISNIGNFIKNAKKIGFDIVER